MFPARRSEDVSVEFRRNRVAVGWIGMAIAQWEMGLPGDVWKASDS